ncbi:MAG: hypothetical protein ACKVP0_04320 [Pirellulaceae bacterium]
MAQTVEDLCRDREITYVQLVEKSGLEETRVRAILLQRWTPSPAERQRIAAVFGVTPEDVVWGHATPIQHLYGSGPG